jgi:bifunctional UDP-N-acetylglucosamine pyrophosphorylase/glucosamine-1-phosphate N-acetyltransferase
MNREVSIVILAAGHGSRMRSPLPKVMQPLAGIPMIEHVVKSAKQLNPSHLIIVIGPNMPELEAWLKDRPDLHFCTQQQRLGTGHALQTALPFLPQGNPILVLYADTPLVSTKTLTSLIEQQADLSICAFHHALPHAYGRLIMDKATQTISAIRELRDASEEEKNITLSNAGFMYIDYKIAKNGLQTLKPSPNKGEYYLTDLVKYAYDHSYKVKHIEVDPVECLGANSPEELATIHEKLQQNLRYLALEKGALLIDPTTVIFSADTVLEAGVIVEPYVVFGPHVSIASGAHIRSFSYIAGAHIESGVQIGPFSRIRPHSHLESNVHVGNFVEIKNTRINKESKINHLSYIGDSKIGLNTNIGAGVITCNYDGIKKNQTTIGDNCFIGTNSSLIAPLTINSNCIIGAGSVVRPGNIAANNLVITRAEEKHIENKGTALHQKDKK